MVAMDRRNVLKSLGLGSLGIAVGSTGYRVGAWWNQSAAAGYDTLSDSEVEIARAITDAMFPGEANVPNGMPNGVDAGVIEHLDDYLSSIDGQSSRLLRLVLHAIDDAAIFRDLQFRRFRYRQRADRTDILRAWDESTIVFRRKAFRGLKMVLAAGYCDHPDVLGAAGIQYGCGAPA